FLKSTTMPSVPSRYYGLPRVPCQPGVRSRKHWSGPAVDRMASIAVPDHPTTSLPPVPELPASLSPEQQRRNVLLLGADMVLFMAALGLVAPTTLERLTIPALLARILKGPGRHEQAIGV